MPAHCISGSWVNTRHSILAFGARNTVSQNQLDLEPACEAEPATLIFHFHTIPVTSLRQSSTFSPEFDIISYIGYHITWAFLPHKVDLIIISKCVCVNCIGKTYVCSVTVCYYKQYFINYFSTISSDIVLETVIYKCQNREIFYEFFQKCILLLWIYLSNKFILS